MAIDGNVDEGDDDDGSDDDADEDEDVGDNDANIDDEEDVEDDEECDWDENESSSSRVVGSILDCCEILCADLCCSVMGFALATSNR